MDVKKLTESAVLCALFVVISTISISLGLSLIGYIDFIVPIFIGIIYLKCGLKYSILSSISSFIIITFALGNVSSGIMMVQSMIMGIVIAVLIDKSKANIFDDLLIASILGCIVMIIMDINFSNLTGYSVLIDSRETAEYMIKDLNMPEYINAYKDTIFYCSISVLPLGTGMISYIGLLLAGKRFKLLNEINFKKYYIIKRYKKYSGLIMISKNMLFISCIYEVIFNIISTIEFLDKFIYIKIILNCISVIVLFFIIQDSYLIINRVIYFISRSRFVLLFSQIILLILLVNYFKITVIVLLISNLIFDKKFNIKTNNKEIINKMIIN